MDEITKQCRNCRFYMIGAGGAWRGKCRKAGAYQTHDRAACGSYSQATAERIAANLKFEKKFSAEIQKVHDLAHDLVCGGKDENI